MSSPSIMGTSVPQSKTQGEREAWGGVRSDLGPMELMGIFQRTLEVAFALILRGDEEHGDRVSWLALFPCPHWVCLQLP